MKALEERIIKDGRVINDNILKVDSFLTHQVDPVLMTAIGQEFASHFQNKGITKVATIESSGISPALITALNLNVPLVIFKKNAHKALNGSLLHTEVTSFTTGKTFELTASPKFLKPEDHILIIDDILANGEAITGVIRILRMAHATVAGTGIIIEKTFQPGRKKITEAGVEVYSLAKIKSMSSSGIEFEE